MVKGHIYSHLLLWDSICLIIPLIRNGGYHIFSLTPAAVLTTNNYTPTRVSAVSDCIV